jgi:hypothetical protein
VAVRSVLRQYEAAFRNKKPGTIKMLRPRIPRDELERLRRVFEQSRSYQLDLRLDPFKVDGSQARVPARQSVRIRMLDGSVIRDEAKAVFRLRRSNGTWVIESIEYRRPSA